MGATNSSSVAESNVCASQLQQYLLLLKKQQPGLAISLTGQLKLENNSLTFKTPLKCLVELGEKEKGLPVYDVCPKISVPSTGI